MLLSHVFANQTPRRSIFPSSRRAASIPSPSCDEKPVTATPLIPTDYKCPLAQLLSLHILTNAPGVRGAAHPFLKFYLNSVPSNLHSSSLFPRFAQKSQRFLPFVFKAYALFHFPYPVSLVFATLTKTAGCIPTIPILVYPEDSRRVHPGSRQGELGTRPTGARNRESAEGTMVRLLPGICDIVHAKANYKFC